MSVENRDRFFANTMAALAALQTEEDRPYNVREIGEKLKASLEEFDELPIESITKRIGSLLVTRVKNNTVGLVKTRNEISNKIGGSYRYYISGSESQVA